MDPVDIFYKEFQEDGSWYDEETCKLSLIQIREIISEFLTDNPRETIDTILDTDPREKIIDLCEKRIKCIVEALRD